ncbi:MAG TPA: SPOR domain-containing protein [Burkholderiaceae bacterium]|nr:SPOR domain-containing protein [Burkholderiaceae bacterium]
MTNAVRCALKPARALGAFLLGLLLLGAAAGQGAGPAAGSSAGRPAEPAAVLTIAQPAPASARDEGAWISSPGWPAGLRVIVTATDSGRVARASTQAARRDGATLFSAALARALQMDPTRAAPVLIRVDADPRPDARAAPGTGLPPGLRGGADVAPVPLPAELAASAEPGASAPPASPDKPPAPSATTVTAPVAATLSAPASASGSARGAAAAASTALYLQVGAFADEPKAWNVFSKVRRMAWPPDVRPEVFFSEGLSRVRVGPFASAQERDAARIRLREVLGEAPLDLAR